MINGFLGSRTRRLQAGYKIMHADGDFLGGPWEVLGSPRGAPRSLQRGDKCIKFLGRVSESAKLAVLGLPNFLGGLGSMLGTWKSLEIQRNQAKSSPNPNE